jgi:hypothetical protein
MEGTATTIISVSSAKLPTSTLTPLVDLFQKKTPITKPIPSVEPVQKDLSNVTTSQTPNPRPKRKVTLELELQ